MEHSADIWAGRFVGNPENLARAIEKLAANNLAERTRPRYHEILFASHPSPGRRAAYLRKLAERINAGE
jgi:Zn-dependent protease with chaperone function